MHLQEIGMKVETSRLLIVGSVGIDDIKTPYGEAKGVLGGAATYSSVVSSFFTQPLLVAVVGSDFPKDYLDVFSSRGINLDGLQVRQGQTFRWSGLYQGDMNQAHSLDTQLGVFAGFEPRLPDSYRQAEYVLLANIDPDLQLQVLQQVQNPRLVACDTMNFWIEGKRDRLLEVLKRVDIAFMNDAEARLLTEESNLVKAARKILNMGPTAAVIKRGEHGASVFTREAYFALPSYPVEDVVDPTGAGDSFEGAFMGYISSVADFSEPNLRKAAAYGTVLASFCVQGFGLSRLLKLTSGEIETRYQELKRIVHLDGPDGGANP
jgi:sugar/nucleoside kinase (ribokinase family)